MTVLSYYALVALGTSALIMLGFCCWFHTGYIRRLRYPSTIRILLAFGAWLPTVLIGTVVATTLIRNGVTTPVYYIGPLSTLTLFAALTILSIFSFWFFCNHCNGEQAAEQNSAQCRPLTVYEVNGSCLLGWMPSVATALLWAIPWMVWQLNNETAQSFWSQYQNIGKLVLFILSPYAWGIMTCFTLMMIAFLLNEIASAPKINRAAPQGC